MSLARDVVAKLKAAGLSDIKVVAGGIIPPEDEATLKAAGVDAVFSPKDYDLNQIMQGLVELVSGIGQGPSVPPISSTNLYLPSALTLPLGDVIAGHLLLAAVLLRSSVDPCAARPAEHAVWRGVGFERRPFQSARLLAVGVLLLDVGIVRRRGRFADDRRMISVEQAHIVRHVGEKCRMRSTFYGHIGKSPVRRHHVFPGAGKRCTSS